MGDLPKLEDMCECGHAAAEHDNFGMSDCRATRECPCERGVYSGGCLSRVSAQIDGYCTCHGDRMGRTADCGIATHRDAAGQAADPVNHPPHYRARTVTGPPSNTGKPVGAGYDHGGRTVTECDCAALTLVEGN